MDLKYCADASKIQYCKLCFPSYFTHLSFSRCNLKLQTKTSEIRGKSWKKVILQRIYIIIIGYQEVIDSIFISTPTQMNVV